MTYSTLLNYILYSEIEDFISNTNNMTLILVYNTVCRIVCIITYVQYEPHPYANHRILFKVPKSS